MKPTKKELIKMVSDFRRDFNRTPNVPPALVCMELNQRAADYYHARLLSKHGDATRQYLEQRGVGEDAILRFQLGFSAHGATLRQKCQAVGVSLSELQQAGLSSNTGWDFFRHRLMVPIREPWDGITVGFGGRDLSGRKGSPKYLNSPNTSAFDKSGVLFGLYDVLRMEHGNTVYLVEGYFDAISLLMRGVPAVAACGTSLTVSHIRILKRCQLAPVLVMDGDKAGEAAMLRSACLVAKEGGQPRAVYLDAGQDPDDFARGFDGDLGTLLNEETIDPLELEIRNATREDLTQKTLWKTLKMAGAPEYYLRMAAEACGVDVLHIRRAVAAVRA